MKYSEAFKSESGLSLIIESTEDYVLNDFDLIAAESLFSEPAIYKYLTGWLLKKYGYKTVHDYVKLFLAVTAERWRNGEEFRFFIREFPSRKIVGITGVDVKDVSCGVGETWSLKSALVPHFMYEAKVIAIKFMKSEGLKILVGNVKNDNFASQKMLTKLGYVEIPKALQKEYLGIKTLDDEFRYEKLLN